MDKNSSRANGRLGATPNPAMPTPGPADEEFAAAADDLLAAATEVVRRTVPSHQAAIAIIVTGDWSTIRKYFSLSPKYEAWADYAVPARGLGIHSWLLQQHDVVRMDDAALAAHPAWAGFSGDTAHPPMRGWLAAPIRDRTERPGDWCSCRTARTAETTTRTTPTRCGRSHVFSRSPCRPCGTSATSVSSPDVRTPRPTPNLQPDL